MVRKNEGLCYLSHCALAFCIIVGFLCVAAVAVAVVFIIIEERPAEELKRDAVVISVGEPLFLTPLIETGNLTEAKQKSRVTQLAGFGDEIYAGFITIDKMYNSNLYFIFFPARVNSDTAPVILWMNGGPGNPSIFCMTECSGPFLVDEHLKMTANRVSWTDKFSILYVDQPVGTGFSFTKNVTALVDNQDEVADGMFKFLHQFFLIFPLNKNDFYIVAQSYGGKYAPAVAHKIHQENPNAELKINLKGLCIASGFCDPESMIHKIGDYAFNAGYFTQNELIYFHERMDETVQLIQERNFSAAMRIFDEMILASGHYYHYQSYFMNQTRIPYIYDIRKTSVPNDIPKFSNFINQSSIRRAFHVGNRPFSDGNSVYLKLVVDMLNTAKPWYEELLQNNYTVLLYNGQFDMLVNVLMTDAFILGLNWTDNAAYKNGDKKFWYVNADDPNPAGTIRKGGNLYQAIVRDGGHTINGDQRERSFDLVQKFIEKRLL